MSKLNQTRYKIAELEDEIVQEIVELEKKIKKEKNRDITLIAYCKERMK